MTKKKETSIGIGKRKKAIARAFAKPGKGKVFINNKSVEVLEPKLLRMFIKEPLTIADNASKSIDIDVNVQGGGIFGQATACRQAIATVLIEQDKTLKDKFLNYDKSLLIADPRRTEPHKPSRSKAGPRRHKQRSKR